MTRDEFEIMVAVVVLVVFFAGGGYLIYRLGKRMRARQAAELAAHPKTLNDIWLVLRDINNSLAFIIVAIGAAVLHAFGVL